MRHPASDPLGSNRFQMLGKLNKSGGCRLSSETRRRMKLFVESRDSGRQFPLCRAVLGMRGSFQTRRPCRIRASRLSLQLIRKFGSKRRATNSILAWSFGAFVSTRVSDRSDSRCDAFDSPPPRGESAWLHVSAANGVESVLVVLRVEAAATIPRRDDRSSVRSRLRKNLLHRAARLERRPDVESAHRPTTPGPWGPQPARLHGSCRRRSGAAHRAPSNRKREGRVHSRRA